MPVPTDLLGLDMTLSCQVGRDYETGPELSLQLRLMLFLDLRQSLESILQCAIAIISAVARAELLLPGASQDFIDGSMALR